MKTRFNHLSRSPAAAFKRFLLFALLIGCIDDPEPISAANPPPADGGSDRGPLPDEGRDRSAPQEVSPTEAYTVVPCEDHVGQRAEGLECALLTMSQNRLRETGRTIELFIVRPQGPHLSAPLPVIVLAGGPGSAHAGFAARKGLPRTMSERLGREVIYYEQRGVAPSLPSTACPELDETSDEQSAFNRCRAALEEDGVDIYSFNTLENAADISEIARILGYEQVDLIAGSYGTRLAAQALSRHPETIRAAILGGVDVPGTDDAYPSNPKFLSTLARAGFKYGEWCAADDTCAQINPGFNYQGILEKIQALIERDGSVEIFGAPVFSLEQLQSFAFQMMYVAQIRNLFFGLLYHTAEETLPAYLTHVGEGDPAAGGDFLARLLMSAGEAVFGGSSVMSTVTMCYDGNEERCALIEGLLDDYAPRDFMELSGSAHPVLFLSGDLDPSTPIVNIELIQPLFPNSVRADFECLGHDSSRISNLANGDCVVEQARAFLDHPSAALPRCAQAMCEALPLAPTQSQLLTLIRDYVEDFDK